MRANARRLASESPSWVHIGRVVATVDETVTVETADWGPVRAARAASCLLVPSRGDLVAVLPTVSPCSYYVVAVLERASEGPIGIAAPNGLHVSVGKGQFAVAGEGINLIGQSVGIRGTTVRVDAEDAELSFRRLAAWGKETLLHTETLRAVSRFAHGVFESLLSKVGRNHRVVTELEQVSAHQLSYSVTENATIHAKNSIVTADELAKVDAKQIHIG